MYAGVPNAPPSEVTPWCSAFVAAVSALATPKSVTIALSPETTTLSGLMSRWTTPRAGAYANADAISRSRRTPAFSGSSPCLASRARSDSPSTNGIVKYGTPAAPRPPLAARNRVDPAA